MSIDFKTLAATPNVSISNTNLVFGTANADALTPDVYQANGIVYLVTSSNNTWTGTQTFGATSVGNTTLTGWLEASVSVNTALYKIGTSFTGNSAGLFHTGTANLATLTVGASGIIANSSGIYPTSNTNGSTFGTTTRRWNITGGTGAFSSTLAAGNTTITGWANVSTNTFSLGTSSIAANGYSRLPNGLLMQWGTVSSNSSVGNITFPTAFTTLYSVTITSESATYDVTHVPLLIASNTTTANTRTANASAISVRYTAIGV